MKKYLKDIPHLVKEYDFDKNQDIDFEKLTHGSKKKPWWTCSVCENAWKATVLNRYNGNSCPYCSGNKVCQIFHRTKSDAHCPKCNESKGEKLVSQALEDFKIRYKREYRFIELNKYRFDFALFNRYKRKPWAVIEYHGEQHYMPVSFGGIAQDKAKINFTSCQKRDKIKKSYCLNNNIKYIEISYKEKDNIKQIIGGFIR